MAVTIKQIIEALKYQKEVFGDFLFEKLDKERVNYNLAPEMKVSEKVTSSLTDNLFVEEFHNSTSLTELYEKIHQCQKCPLGKTRTKFVFGVGNPNAKAMLIGEAPGAEEDRQGEPFVGRAGQLLNDILKAINLKREDVYIANILKCRPPNNRDPLPVEMETCFPYLHKQIDLIKPKVILCLGRIAANALLNKKLSLSLLRNAVFEHDGIKVVSTYHPAALLRNPHWKKDCWEDVKKFKSLLDQL
ncbi:uracil-DNA glycosylase family protein [Melioribacteraceae bacterium 4301-Me]|uniref:uracil-DNA glycosylase n=1 Tax=Pyranulibacter aquaticus TaxID=3163344 RepID=UPI003598D1A1